MLHVVAVHFNPCGYHRLSANAREFRKRLDAPLTIVELSFNDRFEFDDSIQIPGDPNLHLMWQKERMLNIGIESLPADVDRVAWIDADILFLNPKWIELADAALDRYDLIQPFEKIHFLNQNYQIHASNQSFASALKKDLLDGKKWFSTGFAWAARRESIAETGLLDIDVIGSADADMAFAWSGRQMDSRLNYLYNTELATAVCEWTDRQTIKTPEQFGYLPIEAVHLWHGNRNNRRYLPRLKALTENEFDPRTDIALDDNGLWKWNSDKPNMRERVAFYFQQRQDDSSADNNLEHESQGFTPIRKPRNVSRWAVGVTTAPRDEPTLQQSLESLAKAGFETPRLFAEPGTEIPDKFAHLPMSHRDQTLGAFPNFYLGMSELFMRDPQAEAYLICQDDVLYAEGLREYLERHLWPSENTGVVSVYCPSHYARDKPDGFHIENRGWSAWGALAYVIPNRVMRRLLAEPTFLAHRQGGKAAGLKNVDSVVGAACQRLGLDYYVHSPSLAQHIGESSTLWSHASAAGRRRANDFVKKIA